VKGGKAMIMLGIDAHKRTHTVVAVPIRSLKRRISDTIYRAMLADAQATRGPSAARRLT
jgi:hypothetical protein